MTALELMIEFHEDMGCHFWNHEEKKVGSRGYLRRLLENSAVQLNGKRVKPTDTIEFPITQFVLFPKSDQKRITLW